MVGAYLVEWNTNMSVGTSYHASANSTTVVSLQKTVCRLHVEHATVQFMAYGS